MNLALDYKQSKAFDCSTCDSGMQKIRNCGNKQGESKSPMIVNDTMYRTCPRSLTFNKDAEIFLVSLYFDCKENKCWPTGKSSIDQTAYLQELFNFLDSISDDFREKENKKMESDMKKNSK